MDLQKQIEELEKVANQPQTDYSNSDCELCVDNYRSGIIDGEINFTKKALSIIKELQEQNRQLIQYLPRALGLLEGVVMFKDMEEFNKEGAVKIIEEVIGILKSKIEV